LFSALKIEPTSKVEVGYKEYNTRLIRTTAIHEHDGAPMEEYENVKNILERETVFPISIEQYYKFLVLLPNRGQ